MKDDFGLRPLLRQVRVTLELHGESTFSQVLNPGVSGPEELHIRADARRMREFVLGQAHENALFFSASLQLRGPLLGCYRVFERLLAYRLRLAQERNTGELARLRRWQRRRRKVKVAG